MYGPSRRGWLIALTTAWATVGASWAGEAPDWAYPGCRAQPTGAQKVSSARVGVPGSSIRFTSAEIGDWSKTRDWFPREHSALPAILAASHSPGRAACGYCHLPDGSGRPENAKLAGLPSSYIIAQVAALHAGTRRAARPDWAPSRLMIDATADLAPDEIAAAATYFSQQAARSFVRVVERSDVPRHELGCFMFVSAGGGVEPLGSRIVEMAVDVRRFERRDPHTAYVAYVPRGSIERGRALATTGGGGRPQPCTTCHGPGLRGTASLPAPPLAGRFPGYVFRQLLGFRLGARAGDAAAPMRAVVANLTTDDMIGLAAFTASLPP